MARYQEILKIELYAYVVLGNHIHFVARAPQSNIDEFEENVNREIARRLNWKHHREGKLWSKRYDDSTILSEEDLVEAFLYVTTNPTRHGLVKDSREWEGLHCFDHALSETDREFSFHHYSAAAAEPKVTRHVLRLSVLPQFATTPRKERRQLIEKLLVARMERLAVERKEAGQGFLGLVAIREQPVGASPLSSSRKPRPPCYTKSPALRREYRRMRTLVRVAYADASFRYRLGYRDTIFPLHTFLPPTHRLPRLTRFVPVDASALKNNE